MPSILSVPQIAEESVEIEMLVPPVSEQIVDDVDAILRQEEWMRDQRVKSTFVSICSRRRKRTLSNT